MTTTRIRPFRLGLIALGALLLVLELLAPASPPMAGAETPGTEGTNDWLTVEAGTVHTCGIRTTGRLYCWGDDAWGQLGDGGTATDQITPVQVAGGHTNWTSVSAGDRHTCARRATGRLYCWGADDEGQLGEGPGTGTQSAPVEVRGGATNWGLPSAGRNHTCARRTTGRLYCWGGDGNGELGEGPGSTDQQNPVEVSGGHTNWNNPSAGGRHTCASRTTGRLYCWGDDSGGQIGDGGGIGGGPESPVEVAGGMTNWAAASAGNEQTCARRTTRRLFCWGSNTTGQLASGTVNANVFEPAPRQVAGNIAIWAGLSSGFEHGCATRLTRRLFCWGTDTFGQIGNGNAGNPLLVTVQVAGNHTDWTTVSSGGQHTCGRRANGRLYCWGWDGDGQLGDGGTNTDQNAPVEVAA